MIFSHILVPYDGSDLASKSLDKAIEFAKLDSNIKISVLHTITFPIKRGPEKLYNEVKSMIIDYGNETVEKTKARLSEIPGQFEVYVKDGSPSQVVLQQAKDLNCDLIIMGSRGLSGIKEFLGSVSHSITQQSSIPVLLIK